MKVKNEQRKGPAQKSDDKQEVFKTNMFPVTIRAVWGISEPNVIEGALETLTLPPPAKKKKKI